MKITLEFDETLQLGKIPSLIKFASAKFSLERNIVFTRKYRCTFILYNLHATINESAYFPLYAVQ